MRLKGKIALVTGAGSGIGQAIAERFAAEGALVVINYHPGGKHSGEEVASEINRRGQSAIATPINQKVLDNPQEKKNALSEIPWGRFGQPDEVAALAVFLASQQADYVTGSTYYIDGGLTQQVTKY